MIGVTFAPHPSIATSARRGGARQCDRPGALQGRVSISSVTRAMGLTFLATLAFDSRPLLAQQPNDEQRRELVARMVGLNTPGEEHALLSSMEGRWHQTVRIWSSPGAEPSQHEGTSENRMILGGRFLESRTEGGRGAMPVEGLTIMGFDKRYERFTVVGFDTWGTYYITAAGGYDPETRTITMMGEDDDPVLGHTQLYDIVIRLIDEDSFVSEIIFKDEAHTKGGDPFRMVEVTFRRME